MSSVDQIKSKIDIVSLVSSYVKLEKAGANFKGRCPFHNEKTPSFFVSPDRGSYYCFGCHAKGDIFTFVQEFEGLDFVGSLKVLADRAGVVLEKYSSGERTEKERLYSILETAVFFYEKKLSENKEALDYLRGRGVTDETIKNFRIGYAPAEWRDLFEYLLSKNISEKDMLSVGLIKRKDDSSSAQSYYDTFRGRIMFPINDSSGRVVGFSGRILTLDDPSRVSGQASAPKYLNTPETSLFSKSEILFGLDKAKKDIRVRDYSILVEGQMDLIMMHQVGLTNAVASSGTALTENHLIRLRRLSNRLVMSFDGDIAGFAASDRSSKIALFLGMELKLVSMPKGKDPAELAKEDPEKLKECFKNSKHIIDFYTDTLLAQGLDPRELSIEIRKNVLPYVAQLPNKTDQSHFIKTIMKKTFLNEEALWDDLKKIGVNQEAFQKVSNYPPGGSSVDLIEKKVFGILVWQRESKDKEREIDKEKLESRAKQIFGKRLEELEKLFEKDKDSLLFETEAYYNDKANLWKDVEELLMRLEEEYLKRELSLAMINLQKAEQTKNTKDIQKYLEECQRISQKINEVKSKK